MAATNSVSVEEDRDPLLTVDWMATGYLESSGHGVDRFQNNVAPFSVQTGGDQRSGIPVDMSYLMARLGTSSTGFEMPTGALGVSGIGVVGGIPDETMTAWQPQTGNYGKPPAPLKTPWTKVEDSILKHMVEYHGEHKWTVIAEQLPGRAGKQCRERWINHVRPDIKQNDLWTEDDDKMLIEAHKSYGNRWSMIARHLSGRSENAIKNHWNATLRSLQRRQKKKSEHVAPGRFSILEEYIGNKYQLVDAVPAAPSSSSASPNHNLAYNALNHPVVHSPTSNSVPTNLEMRFNAVNLAAGSSKPGMMNLNMPPPPDMNVVSDPQLQEYYKNYPMHVLASASLLQQAIDHEDSQQGYSSLNMFPYTDYFALLRSEPGRFHTGASSSNPGTYSYYRDVEHSSVGGSGGPASDTDNMATLDFTRFK